MLITHDRHLIEACADRLWLVGDGTVTPFDGDLDDYRRLVLSDRDDSSDKGRTERAAKPPRNSEDRKKSYSEPRKSRCASV